METRTGIGEADPLDEGGRRAVDTEGAELYAERGSGELLRELAERSSELVRTEVELVRQELRLELRRAVAATGFAGLTGVLLLSALVCAVMAAVLAIGLAWSPIWVALIGCGVCLALAALLGATAATEVKRMRLERSLRQARATIDFARHPLVPRPETGPGPGRV